MTNEQETFFDALKRGDSETVDRLLAQDSGLAAARDANGLSAVLTALYHQEPALAERLIEHGAPLDLFEASAAGQLARVEALLDEDPGRVNEFAPDGFQALGLAAFFGREAVAQALLALGADPNTPSRNGLRVQPLHSAAAGQNLTIARLLLEHGANPNAHQGEDFTPLHSAAQNGEARMVELLLMYGANPDVRAANGKTPLDYANDGGHEAAAELLRRAMTQ